MLLKLRPNIIEMQTNTCFITFFEFQIDNNMFVVSKTIWKEIGSLFIKQFSRCLCFPYRSYTSIINPLYYNKFRIEECNDGLRHYNNSINTRKNKHCKDAVSYIYNVFLYNIIYISNYKHDSP